MASTLRLHMCVLAQAFMYMHKHIIQQKYMYGWPCIHTYCMFTNTRQVVNINYMIILYNPRDTVLINFINLLQDAIIMLKLYSCMHAPCT